MATITSELKEIALMCINSDEFTKRAKDYLKNVKGIHQPIMEDSELRAIYHDEKAKEERAKAWDKLDKYIMPMLKKRADCKGLWYEVWIDLSESWLDKWFSSFRFMKDEEIIEVCAKYLNERERFYSSSDYYDMLNEMVKDAEFGK